MREMGVRMNFDDNKSEVNELNTNELYDTYPTKFDPQVEQNSNTADLIVFEDDIGCGLYRYWTKCSSCGSGKNYPGYEYCVNCGSTFVNEVKEIVQ